MELSFNSIFNNGDQNKPRIIFLDGDALRIIDAIAQGEVRNEVFQVIAVDGKLGISLQDNQKYGRSFQKGTSPTNFYLLPNQAEAQVGEWVTFQ